MMKRIFRLLVFFAFIINANSQTIATIQQQNARATGYAIVASRNPGKSFAILVIKWDGINSLEYNAANQINPTWHPQAVVKGNYFDQTFVDNDFSRYSSVILSESQFDTYKSVGTDWWIVCSNLPAFSSSGVSILENGNVGIGTSNPTSMFEILETSESKPQGIVSPTKSVLKLSRNGTQNYTYNENAEFRIGHGGTNYYGSKLDLYINGGSNTNSIPDQHVMTWNYDGKVGIGTANPDEKLTVNGKIHAQEVRIDLSSPMTVPDYVFADDYKLKPLHEVEAYIKQNSHLPEIPSAKEIERNGLMLAEMNMALLKKIEELTLYMIEQEKKTEKLNLYIIGQNKIISEQNKRLDKLENKL